MTFEVETTTDNDPLAAALDAVIELKTTAEDDLHALRRQLYRSLPLRDEQAERIFAAHQEMPAKDERWLEFFLEALTDYFLAQRGDRVDLTGPAEDQLLKLVGGRSPITDLGHRQLILRIFFRSTEVSERYRGLVLDMAHHHLMHDDRRLLADLPRQAGTIDIVDLQLIRRLVFGAGGQYACSVDRATANFLLDLDQPSFTMIDQEAWRHLYVKGMSIHLVGSTSLEDHVRSERDNRASAWLAEQCNAGRSGRHASALIQHLIDQGNDLAPNLRALVADSE